MQYLENLLRMRQLKINFQLNMEIVLYSCWSWIEEYNYNASMTLDSESWYGGI